MRGSSLTISKREFSSYFNSPVAYCFIVVFLLVTTGLFMMPFFVAGMCNMRSFFNNLSLILVVFIPAVTMRLWAEERKTGTLTLLFSLPLTSGKLVAGKFLSALLFCILALAGTLTLPVMLYALGTPDPGPIIGGYTGSVLLAGMLLSMGMAISAFFADQVVAFILALLAGIFCFLAGTGFSSTFIDGWIPGLGTFLKDAVGIPSHFSSFQKGVIDLGDVLFFISYTLIFLIINGIALEGHLKKRMAGRLMTGIAMLIATGLFFNATISNMRLYRLDLTENKLYTLSQGTRNVLEKLQVPIHVVYYCSSKDKMPTAMKDMPRDVGDILEEFSKLSPKFTYDIVDPDDLPADKRAALEKQGISPFSAQTIEKDAVNIKRIYSALALSYLDKKTEVIPQLVPDSLGSLEYDLVSKIYRLTLTAPPKVALVAPLKHLSPQMAMIYQRLGQPVPPGMDLYKKVVALLQSEGYQVVRPKITKNSPIPDDCSALVLLGPESLNKRQVYEIRSFLASGRPVFLAVQEYTYDYNEGPDGMEASAQKTGTAADDILAGLGIRLNKDMLFDQKHAVLSIQTSRQVGMFTAMVQTPVNYPMQIQIYPEQMNQQLSITGNLPGLLYLWGSALDIDSAQIKKNGIKQTLLFTSSEQSWTRPYHMGPLTAEDINPPEEGMKKYPLAVMLEGRFPDPADNGKAPPWPEDSGKSSANASAVGKTKDDTGAGVIDASNKKQENSKARLIVIGCSEMFSDSALTALSNASLFMNTMDALCLGPDLINIRNKTQTQRFITPVSTRQKIFWRLFTLFLAPVLWTAIGILRAVHRKRRRSRCRPAEA